jgi:hypothetical protein
MYNQGGNKKVQMQFSKMAKLYRLVLFIFLRSQANEEGKLWLIVCFLAFN